MNHLEQQFIGRELSMIIENLGFTAPCFGAYAKDGELITQGIVDFLAHRESFVRAILWQQAIDFFEQRGFWIELNMIDSEKAWVFKIYGQGAFEPIAFIGSGIEYKSRMEAVKGAIEILTHAHSNKVITDSGLTDL